MPDSPTRAREGNIHHGDPANRSLPMISHLGAMMGPVLGATDSQRRFGRKAVGFAFFGDGASSTGDVHEALNLASLLSLPIVFVIENNGYAYSTPTSEQFPQGIELWRRAAGYGIEGLVIDCADPGQTAKTLDAVIGRVRSTSRPALVEARTLRLRGHAAYDTGDYLLPGEADGFAARDPLPKFRASLCTRAGAKKLDALDSEIGAFIEECVKVSIAVPRPEAGRDGGRTSSPPSPALSLAPAEPARARNVDHGPGPQPGPSQGARRATGVDRPGPGHRDLRRRVQGDRGPLQGIRPAAGLQHAARRERVHGLRDRAGAQRPPADRGIPVRRLRDGGDDPDHPQRGDHAFPLGRAPARLSCGCPAAAASTFGSFHSQELESFFLSMPGLKALYPSTPQDAFNALLAAYEDNNPVLLFEHKGLYRRGKHPVAWDPDYRDVWQPEARAAGDYATLRDLRRDGAPRRRGRAITSPPNTRRTFELFDLRVPGAALPRRRSRRRSRGPAGSSSFTRAGAPTASAPNWSPGSPRHFHSLKAPPLRIASLDLPVPFAPELEAAFRPDQGQGDRADHGVDGVKTASSRAAPGAASGSSPWTWTAS